MSKCDFCDSSFSSTRALKHHQKTAKYCLEKRKIDTSSFICKQCNKEMSTKYRLSTHHETCIPHREYIIEQRYQKQISDLSDQLQQKEQQIQQLQDKLENIAIHAVKRSTVTNNVSNKTQINNIIQKMEPVTQKHLIDHTPNLTIEHVQKGASGYAEYALEYPLKDRVVCVDYARRKIKFKDQEGNVITDPEMAKLAPMFFENIKKKSSELVYGLNNQEMDSSMFEQVAKLFNTNADVKNCSEGIKSEFFHDFVKHVCSGSVVE